MNEVVACLGSACFQVRFLGDDNIQIVTNYEHEREIREKLNKYCQGKNLIYNYYDYYAHEYSPNDLISIYFYPISDKKCDVYGCYSEMVFLNDNKCSIHGDAE